MGQNDEKSEQGERDKANFKRFVPGQSRLRGRFASASLPGYRRAGAGEGRVDPLPPTAPPRLLFRTLLGTRANGEFHSRVQRHEGRARGRAPNTLGRCPPACLLICPPNRPR